MTELSQTVINLETKVLDLEAESKTRREMAVRQGALIMKLEKQVADLAAERDHFLRQNAELHTLLESAAALIVNGIKKVEASTASTEAVARAVEPQPSSIAPHDPDMGSDRK